MGHSMMIYKGQNLWSGDLLLEVIIYYMLPSIENAMQNDCMTDENKAWLKNYQEDLIWYLKGFSAGAIDFELEEMAKDEYRLFLLKSSLNKVKEILLSKNGELSIEELNLIEDVKPDEKMYHRNPLKTEEVIDIIDKIFELLDN